MKSRPSNDSVNFSGSEQDLLRIHMTTMKYQLRIKLLRSLLRQKLATRDVFFFSKGQADLRLFKKNPDWATIESAMLAKISDLKIALRESRTFLRSLRSQALVNFDNKKYKLRRCIRRINRKLQDEKKRMWEKYTKKINHYKQQQNIDQDIVTTQRSKKPCTPTTPPDDFGEYSTLSIFGTAKDLPKAVTPLGPFICDSNIKLTKSEFEVLSKEPKFCLGY